MAPGLGRLKGEGPSSSSWLEKSGQQRECRFPRPFWNLREGGRVLRAQQLTLSVDHFYPVLQKSLEELDWGAVHTSTLVSLQGEVGKWAVVFISSDHSLSWGLLQALSELVWGSSHLFKLFLEAVHRPDSASSVDTFLGICSGPCWLHMAKSLSSLVWGERVY